MVIFGIRAPVLRTMKQASGRIEMPQMMPCLGAGEISLSLAGGELEILAMEIRSAADIIFLIRPALKDELERREREREGIGKCK